MPRITRDNPARDESLPPAATDCLAHRCDAHRELRPVDDSGDDGSECGICVADKFVTAFEDALEDDLKRKLFWPAIDTARDRLNLLATGAGDAFVDEIRQRVQQYDLEKTSRP